MDGKQVDTLGESRRLLCIGGLGRGRQRATHETRQQNMAPFKMINCLNVLSFARALRGQIYLFCVQIGRARARRDKRPLAGRVVGLLLGSLSLVGALAEPLSLSVQLSTRSIESTQTWIRFYLARDARPFQ